MQYSGTPLSAHLQPQPLQTAGRFREAHIEREVATLLNCDAMGFWHRVSKNTVSENEAIQPETLVVILRLYLRHGDTDSAWKIVEVLSDRAARFIARHVAAWHILPQHRDDCIQDVQDLLLIDLVDTGSKAEFWEVRFWLCLKRRLLNIVQKYRRIAETEHYPNDFAEGGEVSEDPLAKIADSKTLSPQSRLEMEEALALLKEQERTAFVLTHLQGWSQQEIAERLQVSDRTVRNLLTRAEQKLAQWREEMH